jgi:hypothetical protein
MEGKVGAVKRARLSVKQELMRGKDLKGRGRIDKDKGRSGNLVFERCLFWLDGC